MLRPSLRFTRIMLGSNSCHVVVDSRMIQIMLANALLAAGLLAREEAEAALLDFSRVRLSKKKGRYVCVSFQACVKGAQAPPGMLVPTCSRQPGFQPVASEDTRESCVASGVA